LYTDNQKGKRSKADKKKLLVRILAGLMALLMVAGMAYYTIYILTSTVGASDIMDAASLNTSVLKANDDVKISVGLMYGNNLTTGFKSYTSSGYTVGIQELSGDREFTDIWDIYETSVSCTADDNLSKTDMTFLISDSMWNTTIGGYHIEVACDHMNRRDVEELIAATQYDVASLGLYIIPSWIYGGYALRIGAFTSYSEAADFLSYVQNIYHNHTVYVMSPSSTAVSVIDPYNDVILFEYDSGGSGEELGLVGHEDRNGNTYIMTPAKNIYDGVFCFKRYHNGETDGVSLINVLPLEAYVCGVLPYETPGAWPIETLKAFAVTIRTYALYNINKHSRYSFDICNTTECQVYKGVVQITDKVLKAVLDTEGMVMTYDGKIISSCYSSSVGNCTVSARDAWSGSNAHPYLAAASTPWESYTSHYNGFWITEVSPETLLNRMHQAGYTELSGAIRDVKILELAENSTYVKKLRVTDIYGTSIEINFSDKVRTSLTPYVKSANFVVGQGSVEYTEDVVSSSGPTGGTVVTPGPEDPAVFDKDYGLLYREDFYVMTASSMDKSSTSGGLEVLTGDGSDYHRGNSLYVITRENSAAYLGDDYLHYSEDVNMEEKHNAEIIEDKSTNDVLHKIAYADNSNNFIFVGKGSGHGVGISQYGAYDLANLGYSFDEILSAYFAGIEIEHYLQSNNYR